MSATKTHTSPRSERLTNLQRTLVLVKPDAVQRGLIGSIVGRFESRGLAVVAMKLLKMDEKRAGNLYEPHRGRPFYEPLVGYMTSGPIVALCLEGVNAIAMVRKMLGATNPLEAEPGTIRGDYSQRVDFNCVHGSDSPESAARELPIFFDADEMVDYDPCHTHWI
ncbi:MAG: nucleoside-diphosphate kinase [Vulcanimicrobiota bacterium]